MNATIDHVITVLNDLVEVLKDGEYGFKTAADDAKAPELKRLFQNYSNQRAEFASHLQARVLALGAPVEKHGSVTGSLHRGWINLKAAISTNEPHAVLAEAERGEDAAVEAYKKALDTDDLDAETRALISHQYGAVRAVHDRVKELRDNPVYKKA